MSRWNRSLALLLVALLTLSLTVTAMASDGQIATSSDGRPRFEISGETMPIENDSEPERERGMTEEAGTEPTPEETQKATQESTQEATAEPTQEAASTPEAAPVREAEPSSEEQAAENPSAPASSGAAPLAITVAALALCAGVFFAVGKKKKGTESRQSEQ